MTLDELLEAAAEELDGVIRRSADDGVQFLAADQLIAVLGPDGAAEFRLDSAVAAAARRTPDTAASTQGPDWVRFTPASLDGHAADRAVAWLGSAARRALG